MFEFHKWFRCQCGKTHLRGGHRWVSVPAKHRPANARTANVVRSEPHYG